MKSEIKVPNMGESISEVVIGQILKSNGSSVKSDEPILEIETDKVNQLLYAPQLGKLTLFVQTGDKVKIGQVIGQIDADGKEIEKKPVVVEKKLEPSQVKSESLQEKKETKDKIESAPAPLTKVDLRQTKEDFIKLVKEGEQKSPAKIVENRTVEQVVGTVNETRKRMSTLRKVIAKRLVEAQQTTAMLTTFNEVDLSQVILIREKYKESFIQKYGAKLGFMPFFVKAVVAALQSFPDLNAYIDGEDIVHRHYYDIGIAVGTDRGLIVPVVRGCDHLTFAEIELAIDNYAKKARNNTITLADLQGGGFTITNGGVYGSLLSTPILNPPQTGILGMHKIEKRAVVVDDQIVIRPMMYLAMSYDHRIVDGKEAVSFLVHVKNSLEDLSRMLIDI